MSTVTTRSTQPGRTLHFALDLGNLTWKLAFATSIAHAPRLRTITAPDRIFPNSTLRSWPRERASAATRCSWKGATTYSRARPNHSVRR